MNLLAIVIIEEEVLMEDMKMNRMQRSQRVRAYRQAMMNDWAGIETDLIVRDVLEGRTASVDDHIRAIPVIERRYSRREAERTVWDNLYWKADLADQLRVCEAVGYDGLAGQLREADGNTARASELYCRRQRPDLLERILAQTRSPRTEGRSDAWVSGVRYVPPLVPAGADAGSISAH